jgi:hypothetical protein
MLGIRIHAIDILRPPGIGISPIADMDAPDGRQRCADGEEQRGDAEKTLPRKSLGNQQSLGRFDTLTAAGSPPPGR